MFDTPLKVMLWITVAILALAFFFGHASAQVIGITDANGGTTIVVPLGSAAPHIIDVEAKRKGCE
jgi:hypothetical protein